MAALIVSILYYQEEQICEDIEVDHRVHSRLIGAKGKSIAKVMEQFQVDVRFPKDKNSNLVTIQGLEENVEDAKYHLITLAEDYVRMCLFVCMYVCVCVCVCMCMSV